MIEFIPLSNIRHFRGFMSVTNFCFSNLGFKFYSSYFDIVSIYRGGKIDFLTSEAHAKNGCSKTNCMPDQDTARNLAFCSLLPKYHLQLSFLMSKSFSNEAFVVWVLF